MLLLKVQVFSPKTLDIPFVFTLRGVIHHVYVFRFIMLKLLLLHRDFTSYRDLLDCMHYRFVDVVDNAGLEVYLQPTSADVVIMSLRQSLEDNT